ncbi:MAG TPA: cytochrome c [Chroococcales cyanobacterium]|jgi:hypothetical protein
MSAQDTPTLPTKGLKKLWVLIVSVLLVVAIALLLPLIGNNPVKYSNINDHFKYGSIGSEPAQGIPYWIWKVLPQMFPEYLPNNGKDGYASLGFIYEPGKDLPIGFSQRRVFVNRVGLNCAVCHTGTLRETPDSPHQVIPTMPANVLNLQGYIQFLGKVAQDSRLVPDEMLPQIEAIGGHLNPIQKLIYRYVAIPMTRGALSIQSDRLSFLNRQPEWGPGRVDTFNPYKTLQFNFPMDKLPEKELIGTADFPSVWNQKPREGLQLHWDGDNTSVDERNLSAGLGAGITPTTVDRAGLKRIADWLWELPPPAYPYEVNEELAAKGQPIFQNTCASCHTFGADLIGKVSPIQEIGTDPYRLNSYTNELLSNQNTLFAGYPERFKHFRKTNGYANMPLDGIWLRAPYLHNGSVPTLRDLLETPENRPNVFYRGNDLFDRENVGFVSTVAQEGDKEFFKFDTRLPGNSNTGHLYGMDLSSEDKTALIEYLKKL